MFLKDKKVILCFVFFFFLIPSTPQTHGTELCTLLSLSKIPSVGGYRPFFIPRWDFAGFSLPTLFEKAARSANVLFLFLNLLPVTYFENVKAHQDLLEPTPRPPGP